MLLPGWPFGLFRALTHCLSRCHYQSPSRYHCAVKLINIDGNGILDILVGKRGGHLKQHDQRERKRERER